MKALAKNMTLVLPEILLPAIGKMLKYLYSTLIPVVALSFLSASILLPYSWMFQERTACIVISMQACYNIAFLYFVSRKQCIYV